MHSFILKKMKKIKIFSKVKIQSAYLPMFNQMFINFNVEQSNLT